MEDNNSKKVAYKVHGREMDFSEREIGAILEKCIPEGSILPKTFEEAEKPTAGKCFKVGLGTIDFSLFLERRKNRRQERIRQTILLARKEASKQPEKYQVFYLLIPRKEWVYGDEDYITVRVAMAFSEQLGGYTETWIEKALGWAQEITNGNGSDESWKAVCNDYDTVMCSRLVVWKDRLLRRIGGCGCGSRRSSYIYNNNCKYYDKLDDTVPGVVLPSLDCCIRLFNFF